MQVRFLPRLPDLSLTCATAYCTAFVAPAELLRSLVYRYDRFARSLRQLVNALCEFDSLGIQFVSIHEGVDTSTPNGRLVFGIFARIAEFERELIRDRVRSGIAAARAQGKRIGRPRRQLDANRVRELRALGWSWAQIARELDAGLGTVHRAARDDGVSFGQSN